MEEKSLEEMMSEISVMNIDETNSNEIKSEVAEMIEESENNFYAQNIVKDMSVLEKEYVRMERNAAIVDAKIIRLKQDNKEVFDALDALEKEKQQALTHKEDYREVITNKLASIGEKKWKGLEVEFSYVDATFKKSFNKKRFEQEQPKLYEQYVDSTPVNAYIKTKLKLLPILPEDIKEEA